jgi:hypothetical protein
VQQFFTSIGGLIWVPVLGAFGWVLAQLAGKQIVAYWELKKEIARCLVFYANADSVDRADDPLAEEARNKFRELASNLVGLVNGIPLYGVWAWLRAVPSLQDMETAKENLIGLSNAVGTQGRQLENSRRYDRIRMALRIVAAT